MVSYISRGKNKWIQLISNCGYVDLDWIGDEENGTDPTGISEMIDYLSQETKILGVSLEQCITIITAELEEVVKSISNENTISDDSYVMFAPDFSLKRSVLSSLAELKDQFDSLKIYG